MVNKTKNRIEKDKRAPDLRCFATAISEDQAEEDADEPISKIATGSKSRRPLSRKVPATKFNVWDSKDREDAESSHVDSLKQKAGTKRSLLTTPGYDTDSRKSKSSKKN